MEKKEDFFDSNEFNKEAKSFQIRALTRKTISYQKRQTFTNICCITLCPLLMIAIAGIMGMVIQMLINNIQDPEEFIQCSNMTALDQHGIFFEMNPSKLPTTPADQVPNASGDRPVKNANFFFPSRSNSILSLPGSPESCVYVFGKDYEFSSPYLINPNVLDQNHRRDTTFKPDPPFGWFSPTSLKLPFFLAKFQTYPWAHIRDAPDVNSGNKPQLQPVENIEDFLPLNASLPGSNGLLGLIDTSYFVNISRDRYAYQVENFLTVPFFEKKKGSIEDFDDLLGSDIRSVIDELTKMDKQVLFMKDPSKKQLMAFDVDISLIVSKMPWGNILFDVINPILKKWEYTLQIGEDIRISKSGTYPSQGLRRIVKQSELSNAFLKMANGSTISSNPRITQVYRVMPQLFNTKIQIPVGTIVGEILYPFGVSFLLPIFVIILVKEKEDRILVMMKMNGLKSFAYYMTHYIHFYILHVLTSTVFIIAGLLFKMEIFTKSEPLVYIILLFIWGHVQIALAFLFACLFNKSRSALVVTFLIVLCSVIVSTVINSLYRGETDFPKAYFIWLPFAFYRSLSLINIASISKKIKPYKLSDLIIGDEVLSAIIAMVIGYFIILILYSYLTKVLPSEYGVRKPWYFIFTEIYKKLNRKRASSSNDDVDHAVNKTALRDKTPTKLEAAKPEDEIDNEEIECEDEDVKAERERILNNYYNLKSTSPLIMKRIRKIYSNGKIAVKDVSFAVDKNTIFGLLGPNGAGKTTLISILTGLYELSSGVAILNNYNINSQMYQVYRSIGVCPQHDILWDDLTVGEHLLFYARLKGITNAYEFEAMKLTLKQVRLESFENRLTKGLSGGEKRRLSIAMALIGNPAVIFLDEPTTGLDPEVRRLIWNIVNEAKKNSTIILTTHSMEEAEFLCSRISIMAKGVLRCIGTQLRLKELYGKGFKLMFSCKAENYDKATSYIESLLPAKSKKLDSFITNVSYEFESEQGLIANLFEEIEIRKHEVGIDKWGLSQTSLDEIFLNIIGEADAEAE